MLDLLSLFVLVFCKPVQEAEPLFLLLNLRSELFPHTPISISLKLSEGDLSLSSENTLCWGFCFLRVAEGPVQIVPKISAFDLIKITKL